MGGECESHFACIYEWDDGWGIGGRLRVTGCHKGQLFELILDQFSLEGSKAL